MSLSASKDQADKLPEDYICLQDELNHLRSQTINDADESINDGGQKIISMSEYLALIDLATYQV